MRHNIKCNNDFYVSPHWSVVLVFVVMLALVVVGSIWIGSNVGNWQYILMGVMVSAAIFHFSKGYLLNHEGIQVRLFGCFPVRKIPWKHIGKVYIFRKWKDRTIGKHYGRLYNEGYVLITAHWCTPFEFGIDDPASFCFKHPANSIGFHIPPKRTEEYIDEIRCFYPNLEIVADNMI